MLTTVGDTYRFGAGGDNGGALALGVDGGGTRTRAVILDENRRVIGEAEAGPSNPARVGVRLAATEVRAAIDGACAQAGVVRADIAAAAIGLAGVRAGDLRARMGKALAGLGLGAFEIHTDAEVALYGATEGRPGAIVIAGTGSICLGQNAAGARVWAGGWGPLIGDEGGAAWISRKALRQVARAADGRGTATCLTLAACGYFGVMDAEELSIAVYDRSVTNDRLAGFTEHVIGCAREGDAVSIDILRDAGTELGRTASTVIRKLDLAAAEVTIAYTGGVFAAGDLVLESLGAELRRAAPRHKLVRPRLAPVLAAAHMAHDSLRQRLALAG